MPNGIETSKLRGELYFSEKIEELIEELKERVKNKRLGNSLLKYWDKNNLPYINLLESGPYSVLSRSIASPNMEQLHFLEISKKYKLQPIILEYDGKFVTRNIEKLNLLKINYKENDKIKNVNISNINLYQGKKMSEIMTYWEEPLVEFHHEIFREKIIESGCKIYNFTEWFNKTRVIGLEYYSFFLSIFLENSILFDNYILSDKSELEFSLEKVIPSIENIKKEFKLKPLICPLIPIEEEENIKWLSYDQKIFNKIEEKFKKNYHAK